MRPSRRGAAVGLLALALVLLAFAHATTTVEAHAGSQGDVETTHEGEDHPDDSGSNFLPGFTALLNLVAVAGTAAGLAVLQRRR